MKRRMGHTRVVARGKTRLGDSFLRGTVKVKVVLRPQGRPAILLAILAGPIPGDTSYHPYKYLDIEVSVGQARRLLEGIETELRAIARGLYKPARWQLRYWAGKRQRTLRSRTAP